MAADIKKQFEVEQKLHDDLVINLRNQEIANDRKLKGLAALVIDPNHDPSKK